MTSICVLISTYNGEKFIREQIDSIVKQKLDSDMKLSIVVRDDGSSDSTVSILKQYEKENVLKWYAGENVKTARSFWDLLNNCGDYDYYAFCDQDDYWFETKILNAVNKIRKFCKPALYASNYITTDQMLNPKTIKCSYSEHYTDFYHSLFYSTAPGCTFVFNHSACKKMREYKMNSQNNFMHDWLAQKIITIFGDMVYDEEPSMFYRQHGNNVIGFRHEGIFGKIERLKELLTSRCQERSICAKELLKVYTDIPQEKYEILYALANYVNDKKSKKFLLLQKKTKVSGVMYNLTFKLLILINKM